MTSKSDCEAEDRYKAGIEAGVILGRLQILVILGWLLAILVTIGLLR